MMKAQQVHALRACSLVAIPPSEERTPPPGGFPRDLSGMNLTSWAGLIQDVAQGMKVVPPNLSMEVCLNLMVLPNYWRPPWGWATAESAASQALSAAAWVPTSQLPRKHGVR